MQLLSGVIAVEVHDHRLRPKGPGCEAYVAQNAQAGARHQYDQVGAEQLDQVGTVAVVGQGRPWATGQFDHADLGA